MFQQGLAILPALLWCAGSSPEAVQQEQYLVPPTNLPQAPYAEWAHYHWYVMISANYRQFEVLFLLLL